MLYVVGPVAARREEKEKRCETNWFIAEVCVTGKSTEKKGEEKAGTTLVAHQIDNDALDFPTSFENPINVQKKQASETIGDAIISSIYLQKNNLLKFSLTNLFGGKAY
ncbi:hypothetical protein ALC56_03342 [Trachymyrmex septentrionalis]|uniref:Uncharacterized protein n=1 Tax=Trachymyrmex septentrionalis TaxID=34720 RepID=A0A195FQK4_9HYME|nr:hypothetical protein ALC56_03342 [Trachymyrmex septentrionalis]